MNNDSIPSKCRDCPHAGENAYTRSWYCAISGAALGSKRADQFCVKPKESAATAGGGGTPTSGQTPTPNPEAPKAGGEASSASQAQGGPAGSADLNPMPSGVRPEDDLVYGYPFDFVFDDIAICFSLDR